MIRRLFFVVIYALSVPIAVISVLLIVPMGIIALFLYIIKGDKDDKLMDLILKPFEWVVDLPYKITGQE